jgi:Asp-tRNA(Asn)/Glu-tRNA(Gln) amidotransferase A subunit family amidase
VPAWRESEEADYLWTLPWSLTGAPAVVVPVATAGGLPVAVQVAGGPWQDHVALAAARCVEASAPRTTAPIDRLRAICPALFRLPP